MASEVRRELLTWVQYFFIVLVAAAVAGSVYEASLRPPSEDPGVGDPNVAINMAEMIKALWRDYFRWWLGVFVGLSGLRFLLLFIFRRARMR